MKEYINEIKRMQELAGIKSNQTAVEYLEEQLKYTQKEAYNDLYESIEVAKQKEKQQIISAFNEGMINSVDYFGNGTDEAEQYYNETFK